jgi:hypothetical protein
MTLFAGNTTGTGNQGKTVQGAKVCWKKHTSEIMIQGTTVQGPIVILFDRCAGAAPECSLPGDRHLDI